MLLQQLGTLFGSTYASVYWCLFPPSAQDNVVPQLQDCQDNLQDRLGKLQARGREIAEEMRGLRNNRDRTRLRRLFLEHKSIVRDISVTENTLWTVDRQLQLLERSELDNLVVGTLHSSCAVLNDLSKDTPTVANVEELTETLQERMKEVHEISDTVSNALQRGLDDDLTNLEQELDEFLNDPDDMLAGAPVTTVNSLTEKPAEVPVPALKLQEIDLSPVAKTNPPARRPAPPVAEARSTGVVSYKNNTVVSPPTTPRESEAVPMLAN